MVDNRSGSTEGSPISACTSALAANWLSRRRARDQDSKTLGPWEWASSLASENAASA
ncbi:MAG: hypothetical protein EB068_06225 [Betaproteobacteria bacterium]|nr:hypothetical protein [Betaproteobacteria bacterium]